MTHDPRKRTSDYADLTDLKLIKPKDISHGGGLRYSSLEVKKLVPWGTDGRLPLSGDFRSLIVE